MVRMSLIGAVLISSLSGLAAAKSCKAGGIYCGYALLLRGDYMTKLNTNLKANNLNASEKNRQQTLWSCIEHGDIALLETCSGGCLSGTSKDDSCGEDEAIKAATGLKRDIAVVWAA